MMEGLFEIHVSVNPINDLLPFRLWCLNNDLKPIQVLGEIPELTFSKYTNGTHEKAIEKANSLVRNLKLRNITPIRVRIEAVFSNKDVSIDEFIQGEEEVTTTYFEFHIKYNIINSEDYNELKRIATDFTATHSTVAHAFVGFNNLKKNISPIITLRVIFAAKTSGAIQLKDELMNTLKQNGFKTNEEIHKEYVFYDSML